MWISAHREILEDQNNCIYSEISSSLETVFDVQNAPKTRTANGKSFVPNPAGRAHNTTSVPFSGWGPIHTPWTHSAASASWFDSPASENGRLD